ncbi:MAG: TlpA family protein disulfide reductase [Flavipsychrobacter sp.]|nr:TlpA family protein disulfide reductase [Flavipsychrobacter sp.]
MNWRAIKKLLPIFHLKVSLPQHATSMKYLFLLTALFSLSSFILDEGNGIPSVDIKSLDGKSINTSEITNDKKPIILCIWEMSCVPCVHEFDEISKQYENWQKETGVKIVAVSVDDNRNYSRVPSLVKSKGWKFEFYQDKTQDLKRALGVSVCPSTIIIDGKGEIVWRKSGYLRGDEETIYETLQKVIKGEKVSD